MGQSSFEEKWSEAFEGAELTPSDRVWTGVEANIANREAARYKRKVFYYRWAVAASVLIIASLLGYFGLQKTQTPGSELAENKPSAQTEQQDSESNGSSEINSQEGISNTQAPVSDNAQEVIEDTPQISNQESTDSELALSQGQLSTPEVTATANNEGTKENVSNTKSSNDTRVAVVDNTVNTTDTSTDTKQGSVQTGSGTENAVAIAKDQSSSDQSADPNRNLAANNQQTEKVPTSVQQSTAPLALDQNQSQLESAGVGSDDLGTASIDALSPLGATTEGELALSENPDHLYGVALHPTEEPKEALGNQLWAGLDLAPRRFDPNYRRDGFEDALALDPNNLSQGGVTPQEETNAGFSWALSFDMGMKLGERWELISGVQYARSTSNSSTNSAINQTPVFSSVLRTQDVLDQESQLRFAPTDLDNNFQFISVPLEAGYQVLDGKVQLSINAGFAADFFLQNTLSPSDPSLDKITINPGSSSPYRSVYFNGLLGAQASYEILPRYSLTLQPQYRVALNRFTKQSNDFRSFPTSLGIGFGIKYNFK